MTEPAPLIVTAARLRDGDVVDVHCAAGLVTAVALGLIRTSAAAFSA
jgi:hypothetical protein